MARVTSLDEAAILALFDQKRSEDLSTFGTREDAENAKADILSQGITIANNHSDIVAAQASIASHGTTLTSHGGRLSAVETLASGNASDLAARRLTWIKATGGATANSGSDQGVGNITIEKGTAIFDGGNNVITAKVAGILYWTTLFYIPVNAQRSGWANPPNENGKFNMAYVGGEAGSPDRFSLTGIAYFDAVGKTMTFGQNTTVTASTTFNFRGLFFPFPFSNLP